MNISNYNDFVYNYCLQSLIPIPEYYYMKIDCDNDQIINNIESYCELAHIKKSNFGGKLTEDSKDMCKIDIIIFINKTNKRICEVLDKIPNKSKIFNWEKEDNLKLSFFDLLSSSYYKNQLGQVDCIKIRYFHLLNNKNMMNKYIKDTVKNDLTDYIKNIEKSKVIYFDCVLMKNISNRKLLWFLIRYIFH